MAGIWVEALPEEIVRQKLLHKMLYQLGYPKSLLTVEQEVDALCHVRAKGSKKTARRADIICFSKDLHPDHELYPLLVIECKAVALKEEVISQVLGYNNLVQAPFVAVANDKEEFTFWYDRSEAGYKRVEGIFDFKKLKHAVIGYRHANTN